MPCFFNGLGRGMPARRPRAGVPAHPRAAEAARPTWSSCSARRSTSASASAASATARVAHVVDAAGAAGRPRRRADGRRRPRRHPARRSPTTRGDRRRPRARGSPSCATPRRPRRAAEAPLLDADDDPIKPARIYGELRQRLDRDAVVICDGGDFASYAGKYVEVFEPGCWLDTGPYGCLGNGLGYAIAARVARPSTPDRRCCSATARPASA